MSKRPVKRAKSGSEGERGRTCFVQGCSTPLLSAYEKRYRLCANHRTISVFVIDGVKSRFCQKCGKFHDVEDFDEDRKSCRASLMRHSQQQRATRQRRADKKAEEEAAKAHELTSEDSAPIIEAGCGSDTPRAGHVPPQQGSTPAPLRNVGVVSVVERLATDAGSDLSAGEGSMLLKPCASAAMDASAPPHAALRSQVSDADQLAATVDKLASATVPAMVPVGSGGADTTTAMQVSSPLPGSIAGSSDFTGAGSMEVLSVVPDGFDIDAALAAVEASLAADADGGHISSVAPVVSPTFNSMDYSIPTDYFAAARPAFGDAIVAAAAPGPVWNDWSFEESADPLVPGLDLSRMH